MTKIWKEKIKLLRIIDTKNLYNNTSQQTKVYDNQVLNLSYSWIFPQYGIYQERGTGRGVFRGNHGDIGRRNKRKRRPWMSRKYIASVYNLREFLTENIGQQALYVVEYIAAP